MPTILVALSNMPARRERSTFSLDGTYLLAICLLTAIGLTAGCAPSPTDGSRSLIKDANLEQAIRKTLHKTDGDLTLSDLQSLTTLDASSLDIGSLEGLQYCSNLSELTLVGNQIIDITPLAGLTDLEELRLMHNQIRDISAVSGLVNLHELGLMGNKIESIRPLAGLTKLRVLALAMNRIHDVRPLASLESLDSLALYDNQIRDLQPLIDNVGLGEGDRVNFQRNPLSDRAINEQVPILQERGVIVEY